MNIKDLRYFCRVYEERGINKAAKQLFISPQGLSKIIVNLEEEFQVELFQRTSKGMIPTECGTYLFNKSQSLIQYMEDIQIDMKRLNEKDQTFEIGFSCGVLNVFPFEKLETLKNNHRQVSFNEDDNQTIIDNVLKGKLDAGFVIGEITSPDLKSKELYRRSMDVLVYKGHPYYQRESLSVKDLKDEPLIMLNEKFYSYHSLIQRCHDFDFVPYVLIKTMESQLIYQFCREKKGLGIDVNIHKDHILEKGLHRVRLDDAIDWKISLIVRNDRCDDMACMLFDLFEV